MGRWQVELEEGEEHNRGQDNVRKKGSTEGREKRSRCPYCVSHIIGGPFFQGKVLVAIHHVLQTQNRGRESDSDAGRGD
jgi:hypothetical protein